MDKEYRRRPFASVASEHDGDAVRCLYERNQAYAAMLEVRDSHTDAALRVDTASALHAPVAVAGYRA